VQAGQGAAGGRQQGIQFLVRGFLALAGPFQVADQLGGNRAAGLACGIAGADLGQQRLGLGRGQVLLRPAGDQFQQQMVQLGHHPRVVLTQGTSPVGQDPQHRELLIVSNGRSLCMRVAASATACASVASVLRPCPVANTRIRAGSLAGTSMTCSPSASSRLARCLPIPWHPSTAHTRPGRGATVALADRERAGD
jgi:hypothetical protein